MEKIQLLQKLAPYITFILGKLTRKFNCNNQQRHYKYLFKLVIVRGLVIQKKILFMYYLVVMTNKCFCTVMFFWWWSNSYFINWIWTGISVSLVWVYPSLPPSSSYSLTNLTSKQKVLLITANHWNLLSCRPPSESSCSTVTLILAAYANVHPLERFSRNVMLFKLPIIVCIIRLLHVVAEFWWMTLGSTARM